MVKSLRKMSNKGEVGLSIKGGLALLFVISFLAVGYLIFGSLGNGAGSFWYYLSNPNITGASSTVTTVLNTVAPIIFVIVGVAVVALASLKAAGVLD